MDGLVEFIRHEATEPPTIIAHGSYAHDFPILLASCMKHNYNDFAVPAELVYVDSMQNLKDAGYRRPGLDALWEELKIERRGHSALDDVKILKAACTNVVRGDATESVRIHIYRHNITLECKVTYTTTEGVWPA